MLFLKACKLQELKDQEDMQTESKGLRRANDTSGNPGRLLGEAVTVKEAGLQ